MAKDKKSVLVYVDWISTFEELEDDEAGRLIKHFFRYVNDKNPDAPDRLTKLVFEPIRQSLKRDLVKYETIRSKNKENAEKRWQQKNATASDRTKEDANHADSVIVSDNDSDTDKELSKDNSKTIFNFKRSLIDLGVSENVASDWLKVRAKKKAANTETAFKGIKREIEKSPIPANESIQIAVEKSWQSFKSEWIQNLNQSNAKTINNNSIRNDNQSIASGVKVYKA